MYVVFSSAVLERKDLHYFSLFLPGNVSTHSKLDFTPTKNDTVLLDEGEELLFADLGKFRDMAK